MQLPTSLALCQQECRRLAQGYRLKGTILLSVEGINLNVAGLQNDISFFQRELQAFLGLEDLFCKISYSHEWPFKRLLVKIKKEIITMGVSFSGGESPAPYLSPWELHEWYTRNVPCVLLDVRNRYEVKEGTFLNAMDLQLDTFTQFGSALLALPESTLERLKKQPVVTFCTGGIRCEKASAYMLQRGFDKVYQLEGGILNYLSSVGAAYYQGACFVFDNRGTITSGSVLKPQGENTHSRYPT